MNKSMTNQPKPAKFKPGDRVRHKISYETGTLIRKRNASGGWWISWPRQQEQQMTHEKYLEHADE